FAMLKYGLAVILVFIGIKMLIVDWYKIPVMVSLATVGTILLVSVVVSLWHSKRFPPHSHS
ncbi:MAG: hypothetical protein Q8L06_18655, partial [Pseudohongiella sp.]|nr:hypothetical protein [Pseudohongiella sp.]